MTKTHTAAPLALCALLFACNDKPATPTAKGPHVEIFTDENARTVAVGEPVALASLVAPPPGSWLEVRADTADARFLELAPRQNDEIRLYIDHDKVAIGVFPPVTPDMSPEVRARANQPFSSLVGVTTVRVATHLPSLPNLTVAVGGKDIVLSDALRGLAATGKRRAQGWPLEDVLTLAGAANATSARIVGAQEITLDRSEIVKALIKPNQRGEYVIRVWDDGAKAPTREVRSVTKIVIGDPD
ncbi:MAG TPA: hypothetical protein VMZ53_05620 [Kofleriaceae bacterium]|nr:hypothetical protein [Kofleriaceae bacterium]